jgi:Spy/CpxP family protein refolding chaperone
MTKRTRPLTTAGAALRIATVLAVLAAAGGRARADAGGPPCAHHGPHHGSLMSPAEHLAKLTPILDLTAAQQAAAKKLVRDATARTEPLTRQAGTQHEEIRTLLESSSPDATRVGQKVIAMHATHAQLEAVHRQELARFETLLSADQRARLARLHAGKHGAHNHAGPAGDADDDAAE